MTTENRRSVYMRTRAASTAMDARSQGRGNTYGAESLMDLSMLSHPRLAVGHMSYQERSYPERDGNLRIYLDTVREHIRALETLDRRIPILRVEDWMRILRPPPDLDTTMDGTSYLFWRVTEAYRVRLLELDQQESGNQE